jgi:alkylated DNA repair dioxygenase AlkB
MALYWTPLLMELKLQVEQKCGLTFNACLLNFYHTGEEGMGWHSDNEKSLEEPIHIASLSFGAERRFDMKHQKTGDKKSVMLENGSLLLMKHPMQHYWKHALPKTKKVKEPRINLTFRLMKLNN